MENIGTIKTENMLTTRYYIEERRFSGNVIYRTYLNPKTGKKKTVKLLCTFTKRFDWLLPLIVNALNERFEQSLKTELSKT